MDRSAGILSVNVELGESERQLVLMALAHLSLERPGWDDALNRIAMKMDNIDLARAKMYDSFRNLKCLSALKE